MLKPCVLWFTGMPCVGKTTIAKELRNKLTNSVLLDGDEMRNTPIAKDAGFSKEEREKHLLKMGQLAKMFVDNGHIVLCSFVSPYIETRNQIREMFNDGEFLEIHVDASQKECMRRDVKGMYAKAIKGEIKGFTGYDAPYEAPKNPEIYIDTENKTLKESIDIVLNHIGYFDQKRHCVFIGRWNGIFHSGHDYIIRKKLNEGKHVLMMIRDTKTDPQNPWPAKKVKDMLDYYFEKENVTTVIIPDVESVEYGRGVGYEVNEIKVDKQIAGISGTQCRNLMKVGDTSWKKFVPARIADYLENYS